MHKYKISYDFKNGEFTKEDLGKDGRGGCDQIIVHSILLPEDGSRSELIMSMGADGKEISSNDYFKSFVSMACMLGRKEDLDPAKRALCQEVFEVVREAILGAKDETTEENKTV